MRKSVKRARIGLISTAAAAFVGLPLFLVGIYHQDCFLAGLFSSEREAKWCTPVASTGFVLMVGGSVGMIVTGILLGVRKGKRRTLQEAHFGRPHRVQWDLARSRVVF
jgi:hypothetical protein